MPPVPIIYKSKGKSEFLSGTNEGSEENAIMCSLKGIKSFGIPDWNL